jgi:Holliday junction resolvasome RuvABC endonuclease subunit
MKVLGLDLSLRKTGVCWLEGEPGAERTMETHIFPQPEAKTVEARTRRLVAIAEHVVGLVEERKPDQVIIEAAAKNQKWQAAAIGELHGVIKVQIFLATGQVPLVKQASEMRKFVVGKIDKKVEVYEDKKGKKKRRMSYGTVPGKSGKPKKATIKDVIELRLKDRGLEFPTQDEMDAYVCAEFCWKKLVGPIGYVTDEKEKTKDEGA